MVPAENLGPSSSPSFGDVVLDARFEEVTEVARGFMGTVYSAWDRQTSGPVALKLLGERLLDETAARDRFEREAVSLAQLRHPNIVSYVAHGTTSSRQPWLAMAWLDGEDLMQRLHREPLTVEEALQLAQAASAGLAWAHARGFVHRDLKPSNLFLPVGDPSLAMLLDFGLARIVGADDAITMTGTLMGTLEYMAPEQAVDAKRVDARADVFSLGVVLYQALTGRSPFAGEAMHEVLARVVGLDVPPVGTLRSGVPRYFEELIARMMMKDPRDRPADAAEVAALLADPGLATTIPLRGGHRITTFGSQTALMVDRPTFAPRPSAASTRAVGIAPAPAPVTGASRPPLRRPKAVRTALGVVLAAAMFCTGFGITWLAAESAIAAAHGLADRREAPRLFRGFASHRDAHGGSRVGGGD